MKDVAILVSPRAKGAYFGELIATAKAELCCVLRTDLALEYRRFADIELLECTIPESSLEAVLKMSFVQGILEKQGDAYLPLELSTGYLLHEDFVFGSKYRGKTSELLTQLLLNAGLAHLNSSDTSSLKLLDPMAGRGTTLLWAMRYGISSKGIDQDSKALDDFRANVKKWCKLHRQKHQLKDGFIGKSNKQGKGKFIDFTVGETKTRLITENAEFANQLLKEKFDLLVSDIPYGIQHFTTDKTRNPLETLQRCAAAWSDCLRKKGVMVLAFNSYIPKRKALIDAFEGHGLQALDFKAPHRMSESIVRDVVVMRKL